MEDKTNLTTFTTEQYLKYKTVITTMSDCKVVSVISENEDTVLVRSNWWNVKYFTEWLTPKDTQSYSYESYFGVVYKPSANPYVVRLLNVYSFRLYFDILSELPCNYWYVCESDATFSLIFTYRQNAEDFSTRAAQHNMRRYVKTDAKLAASDAVTEKLTVGNTLDEMLGHTKQRLAPKKPAPYASTYSAGKTKLADLVANETIHTNANGGKQSYTPACFDLLPPEAIATIAVVLGQGAAKYGANNWRNIDVADHLNHALQHLFAYLSCPNEEDLSHAATRLLFALELYKVATNDPRLNIPPLRPNDATTQA